MSRTVFIGEDINTALFVFNDETIISASTATAVDMIQSELSVDSAELVVCFDDNDGLLRSLAKETPVWMFEDQTLVGKFYSKTVTRVSRNQYKIEAESFIGMIGNEKFYGGVYNGKQFPEMIAEIVRTDGLRTLCPIESLNISKLNQDHQIRGTEIEDEIFDPSEYSLKIREIRNRQHIKLKFNGFINDEYTYDGSTSRLAPIWGNVGQNHSIDYGIMGTFTRANETDPYPLTTEFTFYYKSYSYVIGTPNVGDIIEIDCDPMQGKVTINGVEHTISSTSTSRLDGIWLGGGIYGAGGIGNQYDHHCNIEYQEHKIYYFNDSSLLFDLYPIINVRTKRAVVRNGKYGKTYEVQCVNTSESVLINDDVPGSFDPDTRKDFIDSIVYSPSAMSASVSGWIPICTKREALHQVLLSTGLMLEKTESGSWMFNSTRPAIVGEIQTGRIFEGGSVEYSNAASKITLKEHTFISTTGGSAEVIYTTTDDADDYYIAEYEKQPAIPIDTDLVVYNENAAMLPANVTSISGYPYQHEEKVYVTDFQNADGPEISLEDVTTITPVNSSIVLYRLEKYYGNTHLCKFGIRKGEEKCGCKYSFTNPFSEADAGFLVKMNENLSSFIRAECEFLCGYEPDDEDYGSYVVLTGSGSWDVPQEVLSADSPKIRVVVIGGGNGGFSGLAGENGTTTATKGELTFAAKGGDAGDPGEGGKILDLVINNPAASYSYSCGAGGAGAQTTTSTSVHNSGGNGADSTLSDGVNTYSSATGESSSFGHVNFLNGKRYAWQFRLPGWKEKIIADDFTSKENKYGNGGWGGYCYYPVAAKDEEQKGGNTFRTNADHRYNAGNDSSYSGSVGGVFGKHYYSSSYSPVVYYNGGGCGGGAGISTPGENGSAASSSRAGNGGKGGDATWIPPDALAYNQDYYGYGGHGGGGGGAGGASGWWGTGSSGVGGAGGYGGCGGKGGDGCIIIYY